MEDMVWRETSVNTADEAYIEAMELAREDIARAFSVPPRHIGLLDRAE